MARRSALEPHKDQIAQWMSQGRTNAWMAAKLEEYGIKRTPQQVGSFAKKLIAPTLSKVSAKVKRAFVKVEELPDKLLSILQEIENTPSENWTPGMTFKLKTFGEYFDRIARMRGLYPKEGGVTVAVQVNIAQDRIINDFLNSMPKELYDQLVTEARRQGLLG